MRELNGMGTVWTWHSYIDVQKPNGDIYGDHAEHKTWTFEQFSARLQLLDK
jgi:hypothetical protein